MNHTSIGCIECDVIVVGSGAVGLTTALGFAQQGRHVVLLEQASTLSIPPSPRAHDARVFALSHASRHLLDELGVWNKIQTRRCAYTDMQVWNTTGKIEFSCEDVHREALGYIVENTVLMQALTNTLNEAQTHSPITVLTDAHINTVNGLDTHTPTITLNDGTTVRTELVVACDGQQSTIRRLADIEFIGKSYQQTGIVATVKTECAHQNTAWQRFLPTGPLAFLPLADLPNTSPCLNQRYCSIVWSAETAAAQSLMALPDDEFMQTLANAFEYTLGAVEWVGTRSAFPLSHYHATAYTQTSLALVGDCAHVIHPLAGQGMNIGLLDVSALLQACHGVRLTHNASALRQYHIKRRFHNEITLHGMSALNALFTHPNSAIGSIRNIGLQWVHRSTFIKQKLASHAAGLDIPPPRLSP